MTLATLVDAPRNEAARTALKRTAAQVEDTFKLSISIQDNQVVITPDREASTVVVSGDQILVGGHRLILEIA